MNLKSIGRGHRGFKCGWAFSMNITRIVVSQKISDIEQEKNGMFNRLLNQRAIKHLSELRSQIDYAIENRSNS